MTENITKGEMHGCIVCGKLYQLYVIYDKNGNYLDGRVMSAGGRRVKDDTRALVACDTHSNEEVERAVERVYGHHFEGNVE